MEGITHKQISVNGINMHVAEKGEGPVVLFLHDFPVLWYSWRHQINFLASHGYRAVAPDLRGYGDTTGAPNHDLTKFTSFHAVGDMVALLDAIAPDQDKVFVVGHDWGSYIAWHLSLFRPDKVKALVNLSIPFLPRDPVRNIVEAFRAGYGNDHYIVRFIVPGEIEEEIASIGPKTFLKKFILHRGPEQYYFPKGKGVGDSADGPLPSWIPEEELDYYVTKYEKTGFTGGVNYYRALADPTPMEGIEHKIISANGLNIHIAAKGEGPLVLFLHGFPQLWYSWRHQILFMAAHGYRAVAPDLRGYGETTGAPTDDATKFTTLHIAGDLVALLDAIAPDQDKVFVVGHDWGAYIAWHLSLFRPDKIKALVNLSVPFNPRNPSRKPVETFRAAYGDDHYIVRFQVPGDIEEEIESIGTRTFLKKFLSFRNSAPFYFPKGKGFGDSPDAPVILPSWLSEEDIDYYASRFEKTGFTGAVNYYRAFNTTWELTAPWTGAQINIPAKFVLGELDLVYHIPGTKEFIHNGGFQKYVPLLQEVVVIEGAAHFINEERPDEINKHIYDFLQQF